MEPMEHWRLSTDLSVVHAALLIVGIDPSSEVGANCDSWKTNEQPPGYAAVKSALTIDILNGKLPAKIRRSAWHLGWNEERGEGENVVRAQIYPDYWAEAEAPGPGEESPWQITKLRKVVYRAAPDWNLTTVEVKALREWLSARGITNGFFFPKARQATGLPDYLDKNHPRYAPGLAAAITAWLQYEPVPGKSAKMAIEQWLREHAAEYSLSELAIKEYAKVANWDRAGGAPKTPGK